MPMKRIRFTGIVEAEKFDDVQVLMDSLGVRLQVKVLPNEVPSEQERSRAARGQRRKQVLDAIKEFPDGVTRGELIKYFGAKGDEPYERSISNALVNLSQTKLIKNENGKYFSLIAM